MIRNSWLPRDMGPEVKFNMLPFIMFESMPSLGLRHNFESLKWYRAPLDKTGKREEKRRIWLLVQIYKKKGNMEYKRSGVVSSMAT